MENVVQLTLDSLSERLKGCPVFESIESSSRITGECTITLSGDFKQAKKEFVDYLKALPEDVVRAKTISLTKNTLRFSTPLLNFDGVVLPVQARLKSGDEARVFEEGVKDLGKEKGALVRALVEAVLDIAPFESLLKKLGIGKVPELESGQEYEFELEGSTLSLNIVGNDEKYTVWESTSWDSVKKLLSGFDLDKDYDSLLADVASLGSRVRNRVLSYLNRELSDEKDSVEVTKANSVLGEVEYTGEIEKVLIFAGDFRPPHKVDFNFVDKQSGKFDRVIVLINSQNSPGVPISADQSVNIWKTYKRYFNKPVEIRKSDNFEVDIDQLISGSDSVKFTLCSSKPLNFEGSNVKIKPFPRNRTGISGSSLAKMIENVRKGSWIPSCLTKEDALRVIRILVEPLENQQISESIEKEILSTIMEATGIQEASSGTPVSPSVRISSEKRAELSNLYDQMVNQLNGRFSVEFFNTCIVVKPLYADPMGVTSQNYDPEKVNESTEESNKPNNDTNYVPYMASYLNFLEESGRKIQPLPEIILNREDQGEDPLAQKTGHYDPASRTVTVYIKDRGPKDVLRSFAHEMEHHVQCLEGRLKNINTESVSEDDHLEEIEAEAYRNGNISFRKWVEASKKKV